MKKIPISQPQPPLPLIQLPQWLGLQLSQGPGIVSESEANQLRLTAPANALQRIKPRPPLILGRTKSLFGFSSLKLEDFFHQYIQLFSS